MTAPDTQPTPPAGPGLSPEQVIWLNKWLDAITKGIQAEIDVQRGIRNWVAFLGILAILGIIAAACSAILGAGG